MAKDLQHYLELWGLSDSQLLAETPTSRVYTVKSDGSTVVLKVLTAIGESDEKNGVQALRYFDGRGAVRLLREDEEAQLLEYADGDDLRILVKRNDDEGASAIIAEVITQLHHPDLGLPPQGLTPLDMRFRGLFRKAEHDRRQGLDTIFVTGASVAKELLGSQRELCVLHGDLHHGNIRFKAGRGWLAFDPKGLYGERTYDVVNTLCNPIEMPSLVTNETRLLKTGAFLAERLQLDFSRLLAFTFAHACLSASWSLEDKQDPTLALRVAEIVESGSKL